MRLIVYVHNTKINYRYKVHRYHIRYRLIMHTYILLTAVTCYACYQSIMQAAHSIDWKCMQTPLMSDTDWYCYSSYDVYSTSMNMLSIDHAYNAWYRLIMLTYMTSITSARKRLYMLTCYRSMLYVYDIDRWYMLYMKSIHNARCTFNRWTCMPRLLIIDTVIAHIIYGECDHVIDWSCLY